MPRLIFQHQGMLTPANHATHVRVSCPIPEKYTYLYVRYKYQTKTVNLNIKPYVDEAITRYGPPHERAMYEQFDHELTTDQLITLSMDLNDRYLGASHRRREEAIFFLNAEQSSAGFIPTEIEPGILRLTISGHQVLVDTPFEFTVWGSDRYVENLMRDLGVEPDEERATLPEPFHGPYISAELHTHTRHSDAAFSFAELNRSMRNSDIQAFAMTDHNTQSALYGYDLEGLPLIPGMEWTTFWGHLLVLGGDAGDWRQHTIDSLTPHLRAFQTKGRAVGIAHPFAPGNPWCTGCYWEMPIDDWSLIDYLEVWSLPDPEDTPYNIKAWRQWDDLLNLGHRISGVAGHDWHSEDGLLPTTTEIILEGPELATSDSMVRAIKQGRVGATQGPRLYLDLDGHLPGDDVPRDAKELRWSVDLKYREDQRAEMDPTHLVLINNGVPVATQTMNKGGREKALKLPELQPGWLRAELFGRKADKHNVRLAFWSPFYIV